MWPFNRRKKPEEGDIPPELQHYYESEHRERVGLAWLIAFLSLVLTITVILGLFFGGRWAYRKIANNNNTGQSVKVANPYLPASPKSEPTKPNTPVKSEQKPVASTNSKKTTPKIVVSNQRSNSKLTNTGPGNTLLIFIGFSVIGTLLHELYTKNKRVIS